MAKFLFLFVIVATVVMGIQGKVDQGTCEGTCIPGGRPNICDGNGVYGAGRAKGICGIQSQPCCNLPPGKK